MLDKQPKLSWKLKDYQKYGIEAPEELLENPDKTEGELMSNFEINNWVLDTIKTFRIIEEEDKTLFLKLYKVFVQDIKYLKKIKRLTAKQVENIIDINNFRFKDE